MRAHQIAVANPPTSAILDNSGGWLTWFAWQETSGVSSAAFQLIDGSTAAGRLLCPVSLNPSESTRDWIGPHALPYETGLYLNVISGTIEGSLIVVSRDQREEYAMPVVVIGEVDINVGA